MVGNCLWDCREIAGHWDQLIVRSYITEDGGSRRMLYQEGNLAQILSPATLITGYAGETGLPVGTVMFCGTFPAKGGIRPAARFEMEIDDPVLKRRLEHGYSIEILPEVE